MAKLFIFSVYGLIASASSALCVPSNSCPKLSDGLYCPVNDVTEHGDINRDVKQIKAFLKEEPVNYAQAKTVYTSGQESSKGAGKMRTLQGLAQKDMTSGGKYTNAFYSGALDLYGSTNGIWDDVMVACFDGTGPCAGKTDDFRAYVLNKGAIGIVMAYTTYEMGAAVWKAGDGATTDTGAPYAWDEAAAFFIGNIAPVVGDGYTGKAPGNLYSPYEFVWKRDKDFPDGTQAHTSAVTILNYGLINSRGSGYSAANLNAAQTAMYKIMSIAAIRSAIKYSWKAYGGGSFVDKYLAEGWSYWRSASGYISTVNKTAVQNIDAMLDLSKTSISASTVCEIKKQLESMYKGLGITCAMVGKWKDAESGSCLDSICDDAGNTATLLSGSTNYVDMCLATSPTSTLASPTPAPTEPALSGTPRGEPVVAAVVAAAVVASCDFL